ncbi:uncharacterized protein [Nothobranchius furzeri]|uniref:uncharacterized protein n=1 Tax=Nothobranchius furzeri TaxID=105023 RepID=UPI00390491FB
MQQQLGCRGCSQKHSHCGDDSFGLGIVWCVLQQARCIRLQDAALNKSVPLNQERTSDCQQQSHYCVHQRQALDPSPAACPPFLPPPYSIQQQLWNKTFCHKLLLRLTTPYRPNWQSTTLPSIPITGVGGGRHHADSIYGSATTELSLSHRPCQTLTRVLKLTSPQTKKETFPRCLLPIPAAPVAMIDFSSAKSKKLKLDRSIDGRTTDSKPVKLLLCPRVKKGSETYIMDANMNHRPEERMGS